MGGEDGLIHMIYNRYYFFKNLGIDDQIVSYYLSKNSTSYVTLGGYLEDKVQQNRSIS